MGYKEKENEKIDQHQLLETLTNSLAFTFWVEAKGQAALGSDMWVLHNTCAQAASSAELQEP